MKEYPKAYQVDHKVTYRKENRSFHNKVLNLKGQPVSDFINQTMEQDSEKRFPDIPTAELKDYGKMKERLRIRLIRRKGNRALLEEVPHRIHPMGAETVYVKFEEKNGGAVWGMHVTHLLLEAWDISRDELFETALKNSQEKEGLLFHPLEKELDRLMGREQLGNEAADQNALYLLSNQSKRHGASVLLYPGVLELVYKKLGGDYYILPSSLHEVLVISKESDIPPGVLKSTVKAVNREEVCPEERLGNGIYEYRGESGTLKKYRNPEKEITH